MPHEAVRPPPGMIDRAIAKASGAMGKAADRQTHYHCCKCCAPVERERAEEFGTITPLSDIAFKWTCRRCGG